MSLLVPQRLDTPELLDEHDAPREDVERSLLDLRRINRWLGGLGIYRRLLSRFAGTAPVRSVVDVGTGSSDLIEALPQIPLRVGLDFKIEHLLRSSGVRGIHRVAGDVRALPFRDGSVDIVTSAHFFHHFSPAENEFILRESLRIARRGAVVNDTRRHRAPLLFVRLLSALRLVGRITRFDAPASVLRGYTPEEAAEVAARADAARAVVVKVFPFRFGILLWK